MHAHTQRNCGVENQWFDNWLLYQAPMCRVPLKMFTLLLEQMRRHLQRKASTQIHKSCARKLYLLGILNSL